MMVGSCPCKVSSESHINGRRVSEPVREDKGKTMASELEDRRDPKRARVVLSKGREVVSLSYLRVIGVAIMVMIKRENLGTMTGLAKIATRTSKQISLAELAGLSRLPGLAE
jgi:hypothetical protein